MFFAVSGFCRHAIVERDLFGVFAHADQAETEIRLHFLLPGN